MCSPLCPCLKSKRGSGWNDEKDLNSHERTLKNETYKDPVSGKTYYWMYFEDENAIKKSDQN